MPGSDPARGGAGTRKARDHDPAPPFRRREEPPPDAHVQPRQLHLPISKRNVATGGRS
jgi:hypothetical protein